MKIFREIILTIIPSLAVILIVVGLVNYTYKPSEAEIPATPVYEQNQDVKAVINQTELIEEKEIVQTYSVSQTQLNNYEQANSYIPGKINPFSTYETTQDYVDTNGDGVIDSQDEEEQSASSIK